AIGGEEEQQASFRAVTTAPEASVTITTSGSVDPRSTTGLDAVTLTDAWLGGPVGTVPLWPHPAAVKIRPMELTECRQLGLIASLCTRAKSCHRSPSLCSRSA